MKVLAVDTSTEVLAVAVSDGSASASLALRRGLQHAPALLPLASRLMESLGMQPRDLELLVCSLGPGSFTGIRIGLATVKGIGAATGCPIVGVSTLDALALPWAGIDSDVWTVIDARKGNWYAACYRGGERVSDFMDEPPAALRQAIEAREGSSRALLAGPDAARLLALAFPDGAPARLSTSELYDPMALLRAGFRQHDLPPADRLALTPIYLRRTEAELAADAARAGAR